MPYLERFQLLNAMINEQYIRRHSRPARRFTVMDCMVMVAGYPAALDWIPVTKRLPQPETQVLCAFDSGEVCSLWQDWAQSRDEDPFLYGEDPDFSRCKRATHWMALPPAPEKEAEPCRTTT